MLWCLLIVSGLCAGETCDADEALALLQLRGGQCQASCAEMAEPWLGAAGKCERAKCSGCAPCEKQKNTKKIGAFRSKKATLPDGDALRLPACAALATVMQAGGCADGCSTPTRAALAPVYGLLRCDLEKELPGGAPPLAGFAKVAEDLFGAEVSRQDINAKLVEAFVCDDVRECHPEHGGDGFDVEKAPHFEPIGTKPTEEKKEEKKEEKEEKKEEKKEKKKEKKEEKEEKEEKRGEKKNKKNRKDETEDDTEDDTEDRKEDKKEEKKDEKRDEKKDEKKEEKEEKESKKEEKEAAPGLCEKEYCMSNPAPWAEKCKLPRCSECGLCRWDREEELSGAIKDDRGDDDDEADDEGEGQGRKKQDEGEGQGRKKQDEGEGQGRKQQDEGGLMGGRKSGGRGQGGLMGGLGQADQGSKDGEGECVPSCTEKEEAWAMKCKWPQCSGCGLCVWNREEELSGEIKKDRGSLLEEGAPEPAFE